MKMEGEIIGFPGVENKDNIFKHVRAGDGSDCGI